MTLRITPIGPDPLVAVKLDGRLTADDLVEVQRACRAVTGRLVLDLTDLQFADRQAVSTLRELRAHGAEIIGASPYIRLLLDGREPDATR
jgi:hypothetical protein